MNKKRLFVPVILLMAVMLTAMTFTPFIMGTSTPNVATSTTTAMCTFGPFTYPCSVTTILTNLSTSTTTTSVAGASMNVPTQCEGSFTKTPIIDVQYTVLNDEDSGNHGYWALDNYQKAIVVWQGSGDFTNRFCALVQYLGTGSGGWFGPTYGFQTYIGALSPGFGATELKDGSGSFTGARVATFQGTFLAGSSLKALTGNFGTVDFKGTKADIVAGAPGAQFNATSWLTYYFTNPTSYNDLAWSWVYTYNPPVSWWGTPTSTTNYGRTWVDSSGGVFGDIITS